MVGYGFCGVCVLLDVLAAGGVAFAGRSTI
jgi:hypothetical protein